MSLATQMSLVSRTHHTAWRCTQSIALYSVFLKPRLPVPNEKAFLKPPLVTMPGSLFPRSQSMVPDSSPALLTPRIHRVSNNVPSLTPQDPRVIRAEVHPGLEDHHAEADVSSGALSQWLRCGSFLILYS